MYDMFASSSLGQMVRMTGLDLHFRPGMGENYGVAAGAAASGAHSRRI